MAASTRQTAREPLIEAARNCLIETGFNGFSTRLVAQRAGLPLSQIHYHFGGKQGLVLAILADQNARLLDRQAAMFAQDLPLAERWDQACDFLEEDLASGYVRILQEMLAAGWANPEVAAAIREMMAGWRDLHIRAMEESGLSFGPFSFEEAAAFIAAVFMGTESLILEGVDGALIPIRSMVRKIGDLIRLAEHAQKGDES